MFERLEEVEMKEAAITATLNVDVKDLDTGVTAPKSMEAITDTQMTRSVESPITTIRETGCREPRLFIFIYNQT